MEWIAHRGESELAPENTLAAFNLAWERGADAVEVDVHLTSDGRLVVCHDADTLRTCGIGLAIKDHTLAELQTLDAGGHHSAKFRGQQMPTLEEVLSTVPPAKRLVIEVKCGTEAAAELHRILTPIPEAPASITFLSFDIKVCAVLKRAMPGHRSYLLAAFRQQASSGTWEPAIDYLIAIARANRLDGLGLEDKPPLNARAIGAIRAAGLSIAVWTVDDPPRARELIALGVDAITSNRCAWLRSQLR